jgi:hypothetical protein
MDDAGYGHKRFVYSALRLLNHSDWLVLEAAANHEMHESAAAFDLLSGLLWSLRRSKVTGLPTRNTAWLVLKLMATVQGSWRIPSRGQGFCPLSGLPKRQLNVRRMGRSAPSPYPATLPSGERLESALRGALDAHLRRKTATRIDWPGLSHRLDTLLD